MEHASRRTIERTIRTSVFAMLTVAAICSTSSVAVAGLSGPAPMDEQQPLQLPGGVSVYPTLPFQLGEVDLTTIGVSDNELLDVGPGGGTPVTTSGDAGLLIVDDDLLDCPNATFTSIQAAVTAALPGETIKVCRGTYMEQVTIPPGKDGLTLFSEGALQAVIKAPLIMTDPKAIVRINGAQNVTLRHFTISGPGGSGCDSIRWGVRVDGAGSATITHNHITEIHDTPFSGCQNGIGVNVGRNSEQQTGFAIVDHNLIDKYQKGGVFVDGRLASAVERSQATVAYNEIVGIGPNPIIAQNGIQISRNAVADVHHNKVSQNVYIAPTGLPEADATGILIFTQPAGGVIVHHNDVFLNEDGVFLFTTQATEVSYNRARNNLLDGIYAGPDTSENSIRYNNSRDNQEHDCHDDSTGTHNMPAAVANEWEKDLGNTENKPGLCKHATVTP